MTDEEWDTFALLLDKGFKWREPFGVAHETAYRTLLDGYDGEQIAYALRALIARGQVFGPTPGEIVDLLRQDPDRPTFDELVQQLFGPGGVFGFKRSNVTISPWVERFVEDKREWLQGLPIDDPGEGKWTRLRLKESWEAFCSATDGRQVHEIASRSARGRLGRVDPLAHLESSRPRIGAGS